MKFLENLKPLGLLLLRVALGAVFIYHGYPKLFGHTHDAMLSMERMRFPGYFAYIAGVIEFFCGCMLVAGLFTRVAGLLLAVEMAVGLWGAHHIVTNPMAVPGYEFPLMLATAAFALATVGAGLISFDQALFREAGASRPRKAKTKTQD
jgi:putative oxidoreductase